jgi:dermatan/chondrotin sulfate uronyl 2-O-sulfotransferase UST
MNPKYLTEQQLTYICGSAPECRQIGNVQALNVAKYNAERFYSVIGVSEHLEVTFKVLEAFLPKYFKGSLNIYKRMDVAKLAHWKTASNKGMLSAEAEMELKKRLSADMDFYHFAYQRLQLQARSLDNNSPAAVEKVA